MLATARQLQTSAPASQIALPETESRLRRIVGSPALRAFALSRGLLVLITALAATIRHASPISIWNQWDSQWYVGIAAHGYHWGFGGRSALAFYPLFPALLHASGQLGVSAVAAGLLVSNVAFLGALFYLQAFMRETAGGVVAQRSVFILALFPTAFFTVAPYTESLFLLCALATLFHARKNQALASGLWLAAAAMTHSTALILVAPTLILLAGKGGTRVALAVRSGLALAPTTVAWAVYVIYLQAQHIGIAQLLSAQHGWHRSLTFPFMGFIASYDWLVRYASTHVVWASENLGEVTVTVVFLALTLAAWRYLDPVAKTYCAGFWLLVLSVPQWRDSWYAPFGSMDRFILALFPLAVWAAWRLQGKILRAWLVISSAGLCTLAGVYVSGVFVG